MSSSDLEEPNHRSNTTGIYGDLQILLAAEYFFATKNNTFNVSNKLIFFDILRVLLTKYVQFRKAFALLCTV